MGILSDRQIRDEGIVTPWLETRDRPGVISYGSTSYGIDFRLGYEFAEFIDTPEVDVIDPKRFNPKLLKHTNLRNPDGTEPTTETFYLLPPHTYLLAEKIEAFDVPRSTLCVVLCKSTYARCGLILNVTPGEPEWRGRLTLEMYNASNKTMKLYCGEGIGQALFLRSDDPLLCMVSYADKCGKYQDQDGLKLPIVNGVKQ